MPAVHSTLTLKFKEMKHVPKRNSKNVATIKTVIPTRQPVEIEFISKFNFGKNEIDVKSKNFKMLSEKQQRIVVNKVVDYVSDLYGDLPDAFYDTDYADFKVNVDAPDASYTPAPKTTKKEKVVKEKVKAKVAKAKVVKGKAKSKPVAEKKVAEKKVVAKKPATKKAKTAKKKSPKK